MQRAFATWEEAMANKVKDLLLTQLLASAKASSGAAGGRQS